MAIALLAMFGCGKTDPKSTLDSISKNLWANPEYGDCNNERNILRFTYKPDDGGLMYSKGKIIDSPSLNKQKTEFAFDYSGNKKNQFKYRRIIYAQGNGAMEVMTGDPATVIVDYVDTVTLLDPNKYEVSREYLKRMDTKALFESNVVAYEIQPKGEISTYIRCN